MKRIICLLFTVLFALTFVLGGCTDAKDPTPTETNAITTEAAADNVDENGAKAIALEDAGITETAAKNLAVNIDEAAGAKVYVVTFEWSGFEYQYTIKASTGEIIETMFDGEVI